MATSVGLNVAQATMALRCPFCGQPETERVDVEGKRMIVFPCMFSPLIERGVPEGALQEHLDREYGQQEGYFRRQCDRLHTSLVLRGTDG